ncbi:hypothetical protein Golob_021580 [Gossypium lobatum]|uniref:Uncharacterized protein n=1 Tax=Gossypium lobatum TaxID=34289 RepID=A0A7J8LDY3_9ROSI|nr:hypothetical protein [Gossypium lobatum]
MALSIHKCKIPQEFQLRLYSSL